MPSIAMVSEHASPLGIVGGVDSGGQNIYVANVARQLARLGYRVDVFTRCDSASLAPVVDWLPGVRVIHVRAGPPTEIPKEALLPYMPAFLSAMHAFARVQRACYDVVHANFFMSGWVGLRFARTYHTPLVMTFHALGRVRRLHQGAADGFGDARFDIEDELISESDRIVAECPQDLRDMVQHYGADRARIAIVPCGFDAAELQPLDRLAARARLQWPADEFTVLQLGRMVPRKGVDTVIRAVALLNRRLGRRARLVIAGGISSDPLANRTAELDRLARIAREEGVAGQVDFIGRCDRDRLSAVYSACDVFVTAPWYEPFGITPVEAMACARPVVGAAVGGIQSTVRDGRTGLLVPPKDPAALADRLAWLHDDRELGERMGRAGLARVRRLFTWERVARNLADVYRNAVQSARARAKVRAPVSAPVSASSGRNARAPIALSNARRHPNAGAPHAAVGWK